MGFPCSVFCFYLPPTIEPRGHTRDTLPRSRRRRHTHNNTHYYSGGPQKKTSQWSPSPPGGYIVGLSQQENPEQQNPRANCNRHGRILRNSAGAMAPCPCRAREGIARRRGPRGAASAVRRLQGTGGHEWPLRRLRSNDERCEEHCGSQTETKRAHSLALAACSLQPEVQAAEALTGAIRRLPADSCNRLLLLRLAHASCFVIHAHASRLGRLGSLDLGAFATFCGSAAAIQPSSRQSSLRTLS
jgi:hypothetical protein